MRKRPATATSADFNVVKAYFELKRLREHIEFIEKSSRPASSQATVAGRDRSKGDDRIQEVLRS
jgi:hypothetical protein